MKERFDLSAYYPPEKEGETSHYRKVGSLFVETGAHSPGKPRYSIKLDLVPVGLGWEGWMNAFPTEPKAPPEARPQKARRQVDLADDDNIPF